MEQIGQKGQIEQRGQIGQIRQSGQMGEIKTSTSNQNKHNNRAKGEIEQTWHIS